VTKKNLERIEALIRIAVLIVSGIILSVWKCLICVLAIVQWFIAIFADKRIKDIAEFCEIWNTQFYIFLRYITFVSNQRPFPFNRLEKIMSHFRK